jgi:hypothetical protein
MLKNNYRIEDEYLKFFINDSKSRGKTMKREEQKIKFGLTIVTVVTMIIALILPVQAEVVYNEVIHYDWITVNQCTGEDIHLSGNIHMKNTDTKDASGGIHMTMHQNDQDMIGVGLTSGTKYRAQGAEDIELISQDGMTGMYKGTMTVKLVSQRSEDNFMLHMVIFETVNADGTMTISFGKVSTECHG